MLKFRKENYKILIFFLLFYIIAWRFFTFRIIDVPPGINGDEAAIGYNAALVSRTGHDQNGRFLPLFVSTFDLTDWKQPITFYSTVLAFKIFGTSYQMLRDVSVIIILISATLIFFLCNEIFGTIGGLASIFIFLTIPAVLIQSHLALENIAPIPFTILWFWMLTKYQKNLKMKFLFLSAFFLGIDLFTYPGMRLIVPTFALISIIFIIVVNQKKGTKKIIFENLKFLLLVSLFPIIMFAVKNQYPGAILAYNRPQIPTAYQEILMPYISTFDPSFLFLTGDITPYHSTGKQGVFLIASLPLFILGIISIFRKKSIILKFILIAFFLSPLLYGLVGAIHRGSRLLILLPLFTIIATAGLLSLKEVKNKSLRYFLIMLSVFLLLFNYTDFVKDYWYDYPSRIESDFSKPFQLVFNSFAIESKKRTLQPLIQDNLFSQNPIAFDFFEQAYFTDKLQRWNGNTVVPPKSIILVNDQNLTKNSKLNSTKIGLGFYLLINEN